MENLICEHISVSRKQTWENCQQAYKYRYHLKLTTDQPTQPYFTFGKIVHKVAEEYTRGQGKVDIQKITREVMSGKIPLEPGAGVPHLESDYQKKLPDHILNIKALTDKIGYDGHLEWPFYYDMEPPNQHFIKGFIDRLIIRGDKYFILDYKTTKKGFWRKNANTIRNDLQLRCYARVVQREFGAKADNIRAALFYVSDADLVATKFTDESLLSAEQELHEAYNHIKSTPVDAVYGRVGDQCRRCEWRFRCPYYSLL